MSNMVEFAWEKKILFIISCLLSESEVFVCAGKSQWELAVLSEWSYSEVRGTRFRIEIKLPYKDWTFEVNKLFIIWLFAFILQPCLIGLGALQKKNTLD